MKTKFTCFCIYTIVVIFLLVGCSSNNSAEANESELTTSESSTPEASSKTGNELVGSWIVKGLYHDGKVYDAAQLGTYDGVLLSIDEDGTFLLVDFYWKRGRYYPMEEKNGMKSYLLMTERVSKIEFPNGELEENDVETTTYPTYYISIHVEFDEVTLFFVEYDPISKTRKKDDIPLLFSKIDTEQ